MQPSSPLAASAGAVSGSGDSAWLTSQVTWPLAGLPSGLAGAWLEEFLTGPYLDKVAERSLEERGWLYAAPAGATGWVVERGRGVSLHEYRDLLPFPVSSTLRWRAYTSRARDIALSRTPADSDAVTERGPGGVMTQGHPHTPAPRGGATFMLSDLARLLDSLHELELLSRSSHGPGLRADTTPPSALYIQHLLRVAADLVDHFGALAPHNSRVASTWLGLAVATHAVDPVTDVARMRLMRLLTQRDSHREPGLDVPETAGQSLAAFEGVARSEELEAWTRARQQGTWGWLVVPARSRWVRAEPPLSPTTRHHLGLDALSSVTVRRADAAPEPGRGELRDACVCVVPQLDGTVAVGEDGAEPVAGIGSVGRTLVNPVRGEGAAVQALRSLSDDDVADLVRVWRRAAAAQGDPALWWDAHNAAGG